LKPSPHFASFAVYLYSESRAQRDNSTLGDSTQGEVEGRGLQPVGGGGRLNLFFEAFFDQTNPKSSYEMTGPIWIPSPAIKVNQGKSSQNGLKNENG